MQTTKNCRVVLKKPLISTRLGPLTLDWWMTTMNMNLLCYVHDELMHSRLYYRASSKKKIEFKIDKILTGWENCVLHQKNLPLKVEACFKITTSALAIS